MQPQQLHFPYALGTVAAWECPGMWGMDAGLSSSFRQLPVSCLCCLLGDTWLKRDQWCGGMGCLL